MIPAPGYLEGRCLSYGSVAPYLPLLDLLRAQCGITPADGAVAISGASSPAWRHPVTLAVTHELATLQAALAHAIEGRGQVVGIVGEPGIGKSRLLAEWRQQLPSVPRHAGR